MTMAQLYEKESEESKRLRKVTFIAVLISTTAVLSSVVTLPMVYSYIQAMQTHMSGELDHCRAKTRDLWVEVFAAQDSLNVRRTQGKSEAREARTLLNPLDRLQNEQRMQKRNHKGLRGQLAAPVNKGHLDLQVHQVKMRLTEWTAHQAETEHQGGTA
ncbi:nematode cuticle collagen domain protein [Teladorsagia circumcincta]|uniref:Nematode cuticle collagen domain protein n=1 Tax=Teladorsagia circumcincta TaxID=45464 RepID=A0A2G9V241_TELCI|nr:nematode cuticle collagen domain protein [Teladorsagia circumcincta]